VNVVAAARSEKELAETERLASEKGGSCKAFPADVTSPEAVDALVGFAQKECGGVDILVNNAGKACGGEFDAMEVGDFDRMINVNVRAPFLTARAVWPVMRKRGGGVIVNMSSVAGVDPFPGLAAYGGTKAFVDGLTRGLANEGKPLGIRAHAVGPGAVETQMLRAAFPDFPADQCLSTEDVADLVWEMCQPTYRHSVGQTVYINKA